MSLETLFLEHLQLTATLDQNNDSIHYWLHDKNKTRYLICRYHLHVKNGWYTVATFPNGQKAPLLRDDDLQNLRCILFISGINNIKLAINNLENHAKIFIQTHSHLYKQVVNA